MKIPNLDTLSTFIDRLIIENIKKETFLYRINNKEYENNNQKKDLISKVDAQDSIINDVKEQLKMELACIMTDGKYEYYKEKRTFS